MPHWEHFAHGSDIGIRGVGDSLSEAFEMVAVALTALVGSPASIQHVVSTEFQIHSQGADYLLYDWIARIVYEMATRHMLFSKFVVEIDSNLWTLKARISGEPIDLQRHDPGVEVKGPTFTELKVAQFDRQWLCQCVVDV